MYNKQTIIGNLGKDPTTKTTPTGKIVTEFSVGTKNRDDSTEWFNVLAWDKLGEVAGKFLAKGKMVFVEGRTKTHSYQDKSGATKYRTEVIAEEIKFLSPKGETTAASSDDLPF